MTNALTIINELLPLIDQEIEQRKTGGNAEDWRELEALSNRAHAIVRAANDPFVDAVLSIRSARESRLREQHELLAQFHDILSRMLPFVDDALDAQVHFFHESAASDDCREVVAEARALLAATVPLKGGL